MWDNLKYVPFKLSYFVTQLAHQDLRLRGAKFKARNSNGFCTKSVKDNRQENYERLSVDLKISALKEIPLKRSIRIMYMPLFLNDSFSTFLFPFRQRFFQGQ